MRCVSLFAGCGGLDLGLEQAGFSIALAVDNWDKASESYTANRPDVPFYCGSVADLTAPLMKQLSKGEAVPGIDLLAGGPPCPPYSKSRFYRKSKPRALEDKVGQETLEGYLKALRLLRPRAFLLENVAGLAYKVHSEALRLLEDTARKLGYTTNWRVVNAANYGVPQIRERFFIVGLREGQFEFPPQTHSSCDARAKLKGLDTLSRWVNAGQAIGELDTDENADDTGHYAGGQYHDLLEQVPPGDNYLFFTKERGHRKPKFKWRSRYWSFLLKLSPGMPSWTIQARRSNNMGPFHWRNRILRIEEVKRLQTFPNDWQLSGRVEDQWRQLGNAVPPLLAECLGKALAAKLSGVGRKRRQRVGALVTTNRTPP
jgi:DNA (cytosine-5)-methyltransferase 1